MVGVPIQILVGEGSLNNFFQPRLAHFLQLLVEPTPDFNVLVGNGQSMVAEEIVLSKMVYGQIFGSYPPTCKTLWREITNKMHRINTKYIFGDSLRMIMMSDRMIISCNEPLKSNLDSDHEHCTIDNTYT